MLWEPYAVGIISFLLLAVLFGVLLWKSCRHVWDADIGLREDENSLHHIRLAYDVENLRCQYQYGVQSCIACFEFIKDFTKIGFTMVFTINGAAAAGLLVFLGPLLEFHSAWLCGILWTISAFLLGVSLAILSCIVAYFAQIIYLRAANYSCMQIQSQMAYNQTKEQQANISQVDHVSVSIYNNQSEHGDALRNWAIGFILASFLVFGAGVIIGIITTLYW